MQWSLRHYPVNEFCILIFTTSAKKKNDEALSIRQYYVVLQHSQYLRLFIALFLTLSESFFSLIDKYHLNCFFFFFCFAFSFLLSLLHYANIFTIIHCNLIVANLINEEKIANFYFNNLAIQFFHNFFYNLKFISFFFLSEII